MAKFGPVDNGMRVSPLLKSEAEYEKWVETLRKWPSNYAPTSYPVVAVMYIGSADAVAFVYPEQIRHEKSSRVKFFFDTEFIEDGKTIDLISIAIVREDGAEYYAVSNEFDESKASPWVRKNVLLSLISRHQTRIPRQQIKEEVLAFVGKDHPEFWAYYADYDWVAMCQLFGTMMNLPEGWPMYCHDLKQLVGSAKLERQASAEHHALNDARWVKASYERFMKQG